MAGAVPRPRRCARFQRPVEVCNYGKFRAIKKLFLIARK
jgi:hypothetical protein